MMLGAAAAHAETAMTAATVLEELSADERFSYIAGIVDGLAHARLETDTLAKGESDQEGMNCIYRWFYRGDGSAYALIETAFQSYQEHYPATLVSVLIRRECGN